MYWSEDSKKKPDFVVPDDIVDMAFAIRCPTLPIDHAYTLSRRLQEALPWLREEALAGVHLIHGAASGNGWYRPQDTAQGLLHLSRRTRMRLRLPKQRLDDARELTGQTLDIDGHPLEIGKSEIHKLSALPTLFARHVIMEEGADEVQFLEDTTRALREIGIECRKMLCGITHTHAFPEGCLHTRSLMVADLEPEQSVRLQQLGLGEGRKQGFGLFIPHKGIKPVKETDGE